MESHHNTTNEKGKVLKDFEDRAKGQEGEILRLFKRQFAKKKSAEFSPSQIHNRIWYQDDKNYPITSVRRALTNLTGMGLLEKTNKKRMGPYGRPEYIWRFVPEASSDATQKDLF